MQLFPVTNSLYNLNKESEIIFKNHKIDFNVFNSVKVNSVNEDPGRFQFMVLRTL